MTSKTEKAPYCSEVRFKSIKGKQINVNVRYDLPGALLRNKIVKKRMTVTNASICLTSKMYY